jgi:choline monooxygenase
MQPLISGPAREKLALAIAEGGTLPTEWYTDPRVHEFDVQMVFRKTWQYAGRDVDLGGVGAYQTRTIAGIPVVIVRGRDEKLRALVNVCRHRFNKVIEGEGTTRSLQCQYHAWTYRLDGSLAGASRHGEEANFDRSCYGLLSLKLEVMNGLLFVNADADAAPLADTIANLPQLLERHDIDYTGLELRERFVKEVACNWKVYMEGAAECYHCPSLHGDFAKVVDLDYNSYREYQEARVWAMMAGLLGEPDEIAHPNRYQFYSIWPNIIIAPEFMPKEGKPRIGRIFTFSPAGADACTIESELFAAPDVGEEELTEYKEFWYQVMREDFEISERAYGGVKSGLMPRGKLMLESEGLIHTWYERYLECVDAGMQVVAP